MPLEDTMSLHKLYTINFVGSFTTGYVGEKADECLLADELEKLGHRVRRIPRDIWKAHVEEGRNEWEILNDLKADINIVAKWHHFGTPEILQMLKEKSNAPVFYWVWDWMQWPQTHEWHKTMCENADLSLTNEGGDLHLIPNSYYFNFDVADGGLLTHLDSEKIHDVTFFGTFLGQGDRKEWLPEIAKTCNLSVFSWNYADWQSIGITANPPVWGNEFNKVVGQSKICLQFSVNDHIWGYWSNRVGKILTAGGFLLARYAPGMEIILRDGAEYFSSVEECQEKIKYYLEHEDERDKIALRGAEIGRDKFTVKARVKELEILIDRFLHGRYQEISQTSQTATNLR